MGIGHFDLTHKSNFFSVAYVGILFCESERFAKKTWPWPEERINCKINFTLSLKILIGTVLPVKEPPKVIQNSNSGCNPQNSGLYH